ncbi:MAG: AMP-binding protein, partial [Acidobacteria bacterium]|nr:AMP-binding protein [Acidobacteriota bacterium]
PKGVMIDHRGALNTVVDVNQRFRVGPQDRVLALSALNFDLSVYDVFGLLSAGGALVMPEPESLRDPSHWLDLLLSERVTVWNTVPALMEMLVQYLGARDLPESRLRVALLSGDWIPVTLPERLRSLFRGVETISLGGATEASIWSILYAIEEVDPAWPSIPYGRPMVNQRFHVLDTRLEPCPAWVPGHLYIGGVGLARGYWRDEEKTRASFVSHPRTGEGLYRTGDLGRYLPDGTIEFLGREDFQVKIQGHRIELGEIEAVLLQHPSVETAVVLAVGERRAGRRLVGYVVAREETSSAELREFLGEKLPAYMVPATLVRLESLPLTSNGKVDRVALAEMAAGEEEGMLAAGFAAPRTPVEDRLAGLWSELLGAERVGIHDSFFDLGGNSLVAIRMITRLREMFGVEMPLRALFGAPTVAELGAVLHGLREERSQQPGESPEGYRLVPSPASRYEPFPLNDVQHAYWVGRTGAFDLGNVAAHGY